MTVLKLNLKSMLKKKNLSKIKILKIFLIRLQDRHAKSLRDLNFEYQIESEKSDNLIKVEFEKNNCLQRENEKLKKEIFSLNNSKISNASICVQSNRTVVKFDKDTQTEIHLDSEDFFMLNYDQELNKSNNSTQTEEEESEIRLMQNEPDCQSYYRQNDELGSISVLIAEINEESESDLSIESSFQQEKDETELSNQLVEKLGEIKVDENRKFQLKTFLIFIGYYYLFLFLYMLWSLNVNEENFGNKHSYTVSLMANYFSEVMSTKKLHKSKN